MRGDMGVPEAASVRAFVCLTTLPLLLFMLGITTLYDAYTYVYTLILILYYVLIRVRWGLERVAVVDIDVHFGNGTAEILQGDPRAFFASVHMVYGTINAGVDDEDKDLTSSYATTCSNDSCTIDHVIKRKLCPGFYPSELGRTELSDNYVSVGILPGDEVVPVKGKARGGDSDDEDDEDAEDEDASVDEDINDRDSDEDHLGDDRMDVSTPYPKSSKATTKPTTTASSAPVSAVVKPGDGVLRGSAGFRRALSEAIIPRLEKYNPQLLIMSGMT